MDLISFVTLSLGCMVTAFWIAPITAIQNRISLTRHINAEVDRETTLAGQVLAEMIFDTSYSLQQVLNHFEPHRDPDGILTSHRTQMLMLKFKQELAFSVAYFALSEMIHRANPEKTASEQKDIETFLTMFLKIQVHKFSTDRDFAIDAIREEVFFAFAQLDLDGKITDSDKLVNLAEVFLKKSNLFENTVDKTK